ncbi:hypothetical protein M2277_004921 [Paenibacillus sp. LBL]|uniref:phage tail domain-containing protein n=1 Tax=Paenibacillus sp. LBL TaxID=2940563 RepID=UPI00247687D2|nr:phage tail domain-containing protein [Paenibacillus sp. LBL]MDH6674229.1 hypothetical protein [Paenibacillus sp. LBL]
MPTWASVAGFEGHRESPELPVSLEGDGAVSTVKWSGVIPSGTSISLSTNVSFDGGHTWMGWKKATNGGSIPDVTTNTDLTNLIIKYRSFLSSESANVTPELSEVVFTMIPVIQFENAGDYTLKPEMWITKVGNGDISIVNMTDNNREFKFTGLIDGETVYLHNEREYIETSLALVYRYDNFNDNFLELLRGINVLRVNGDAKIQFRYQFKTLQG